MLYGLGVLRIYAYLLATSFRTTAHLLSMSFISRSLGKPSSVRKRFAEHGLRLVATQSPRSRRSSSRFTISVMDSKISSYSSRTHRIRLTESLETSGLRFWSTIGFLIFTDYGSRAAIQVRRVTSLSALVIMQSWRRMVRASKYEALDLERLDRLKS